MADPTARCWQFVPSTVARGRDERAAGVVRRSDALRAALGLVSEIQLRWESGPGGGIRLGLPGLEASEWAARCLFPAYPRSAWRPATPRPGDRASPPFLRFGTPLRPASSPFPADPARPWPDVIAPALGGLPEGLRVLWTLRPGGVATLPPTTGPAYDAQPPGLRVQPLTEPEREARDRLERRRREPFWAAQVVLEADSIERLRPAAERLARLVESASGRGGENRLRFVPPLPLVRRRAPMWILSEGEVAAILPGDDTRLTSTDESERAEPEPGLAVGHTDPGVVARLPCAPTEGRHLAILGGTGMGKSSALLALALEASRRGGVVLLDPIGDTGRALLARLSRADLARTVWISPTESPVAVDLMASIRKERVGPVAADRALSDVVDALRRVRQSRYSEAAYWGPRIEETVRRAMAASAALPNGTLQDAERLLDAVGRRPVGVPPEAQAAVEELWRRARDRPEEVDGSRRLLAEITGRPALARMLTAPHPRFAPSELSAEGRIVVITAEAAQIGEAAARYLLALHLALFWSARLAIPRPPKTFLFLEEAQWYAHESVAEMLRLGRRTNVHLYLATQALGSLSESVAEAVRTNAADFLVFRGAPDDAREFARWTPQVDPVELLSLTRGRALLLRGKGALITLVTVPRGPEVPRDALNSALEHARAVSRAFWPEYEPGENPDTATAPTPPATSAASADRFRDLWVVLWAAVLDDTGAGPIRIPLRRLRAAADPGGDLVREAGRMLHASGTILRSDRDPEGAWWEVSRSGVAELVGPGVGAEELADATRRWRAGAPSGPS